MDCWSHTLVMLCTCCTYLRDVCATAVRTVSRFHVSLYTHLDEVLRRTQPRKSVVFALDGPAPLAKLLTQRCDPKAASALPFCRRVAEMQAGPTGWS